MKEKSRKSKKVNILFIATYQNYFIKDHANFSRMYNNLEFFHKNKTFNVFVLQPFKNKNREIKELKKGIKIYYFREIKIGNKYLVPFIDLNPFFIYKIYKIIKRHKIHLIHIEFVYGINVLRLFKKIPVSYNAYNVESIYVNEIGKYYYNIPKFFRFFYSIFIFLLERSAVKTVNNINVVSEYDKKQFVKIYNIPEEKILVSPFGVKKDISQYIIGKKEARKNLNLPQNKFIVIFHGSYLLNYGNEEAVLIIKNKIAPRINDDNIIFIIAGKMPLFNDKKNIKFLGYVKNLRDFIYSADIAIAPILRGSGVKTKIVDYLSANIPIVTTKKGAEGLLLKNGVHGYIVKDVIDDIIQKILELKNNPHKIKEFRANIKKLLKEEYNWDEISKNLGKRYREIIKRK